MASVEGTRQESMEQLGQSSKENASLKTELQKTWHENQAMAQEVKSEMLHISLIFFAYLFFVYFMERLQLIVLH